ncbi:MAG: HAMP domain-containing histidine kinase [Clostridia bacterium]|nr:HAMP domain-containing histidine kinase [Clostridia bacterium]
MKRLSVKLRVTLLCALLAAVIAAAAIAWMLAGEQRTLEKYYRETLVSTARLARDEIFYESGRLEIDRNLDELPGVGVAVFNADGDLLYGRIRFEKEFLPGQVHTADSLSGRWWVYDEMLDFSDGPALMLRCFISAGVESSVRGGQNLLVLMIFPAMVLLGGLGGYFIARRAFRPVSRIVRTAESIADGDDLKKRIGFTGARDELYAVASTFDEMFARLDGAFERERRFTSDASHELRTPVAGILAQSEFALSEAATDDDRTAALQEIRRRAGDMSSLIGKLLTLSRMDAKRIRPEWEEIDLALTAEIALSAAEDAAEKKNIALTLDAPDEVRIRADQTMAAQAAVNLVENAVKYGGGFVRAEVREDAKNAYLTVTDGGPGIPEEQIPKLFERFWQADPSHRSDGAGLGLSLAERIMALHGGRIEVESRPGEGARFTLIFPKAGDI